ncbi:MAG: response regulator transcription factor [Leptospirales bacterium]
MDNRTLNIVIVEDDLEIGQHISCALNGSKDFKLLKWFKDGIDVISKIPETTDVVILDLGLPDGSGLDLIKPVKEKISNIKIVVFTIFEDDDKLISAIAQGANGYLLKDIPDELLLRELKSVCLGSVPISPKLALNIITHFTGEDVTGSPISKRENEVLGLISLGYTYKDIADELNISPNTVRRHTDNIYRKLEVNSKSEALIKAKRGGFLKPPLL